MAVVPDAEPAGDVLGVRPAIDALDHRMMLAAVESRLFGSDDPVMLGRYRVLAEIGRGGGGRVYRAFDPRLSRPVAIKVFRPAVESRGDLRLRREAEALGRLSHPHIVDVFDVFETDDAGIAVVMEWVEGSNLEDWIARHRPGPGQIVEAFVDLAAGLAAVHEAGWVHRDVKPTNVLVGDDGRVRLADFGLARLGPESTESEGRSGDRGLGRQRVTQPGDIPGTPAFMAPEAVMGSGLDARSDQFAFCVSLFEALHGHLPDRDEPEVDRTLPLHVQRVLTRGLSPDPPRRFATMRALGTALAGNRRRRVRAALRWPATLALGLSGLGVWAWPEVPRTSVSVSQVGAWLPPAWHDPGAEGIRSTLARGRSERLEGRYTDALETLASAVEHAAHSDVAELLPEARSELGATLVLSGRVADGVAELERAYDLAIARDLDSLAAGVATDLVFAAGYSAADRAAGQRWARHAQAILDRIDATGEAQAKLDSHLGSVESLAGHYDRAEALMRGAEAIRRGDGEPARARLASTLNNLGNVHIMRGDIGKARACHAEALELRRAVFGPEHDLVAISLNNLAGVELHVGDTDAAEGRLREAVRVMEVVSGPMSRDLVHPLQNLATLALQRAAPMEAETLARRSKQIAVARYDEDDPRIAVSAEILARVLHDQQRYDEAFTELFAALRIARTALGDEHQEVASMNHAIAGVFLSTQRYPEALPYAQSAHRVWLKTLGTAHRNTAASALRLGHALVETGQLDQAGQVLGAVVGTPGFEDLPPHDKDAIEVLRARASVNADQPQQRSEREHGVR